MLPLRTARYDIISAFKILQCSSPLLQTVPHYVKTYPRQCSLKYSLLCRPSSMCTFFPSSCTVQLLPADAARILPWSQHCSSAPFQVFSLYPTLVSNLFLLWYLTWMNIALNSLFPIHGSSYSVRKKRRMNYYYCLTHCWSRGIFLRPSGEGNCRSSARCWHWWRSWLRRGAGQWRGRPTYSKLFLYF